jgi:signal transduction histidine kinase/DNA-binding response OmpR family regulator/CHASE3 domain sensor protein
MQGWSSRAPGRDDVRFSMEPRTFAGFLVAIAAVVVIAVLSYESLRATENTAESLAHTAEVQAQTESLLSTLKDAETGQRGYLLTGREAYLAPFVDAKHILPGEFSSLAALIGDDPAQRNRVETLKALATEKIDELTETVELRRAGQTDAALNLVLSDRGKNTMDRIRGVTDEMISIERRTFGERALAWRKAATAAFWVTSLGSLVLLVLIGVAMAMTVRDFKERQRESWLRAGQIGLSEAMIGDLPLERLGENVLRFLTQFLDAQVGAVFVADGAAFKRLAGHGLPAEAVAMMRPGDGLAGQAAKDNAPIRVRDVPPGYLPVGSSTGQADARELLIAPLSIEQHVYAVIELGFFGQVGAGPEELLRRVSEPIAAAIRASTDRRRLEELLQETQQQTEELQTREEELRVNNEELEEQGRTLRESRAQLESQQTELEQINAQLEEQAQTLEHQRDSIARSHESLAVKSLELQRANEYKSEFLANMSHELRTPLNSTLILAKLLADNKEGNLTENQVRYAQTISSAGKDLLALINDVLDLSRIEAGKVDVTPESVSLEKVIDHLAKMFEPAAAEKRLKFATVIESGTPATVETDPQRLGQILKNLLSNALKFTHRGEIGLRVSAAGRDAVSFAVRDTGVGIAPHQQEVIFEAFRQADGSIHRKFGGTGLGLSISRDLARLLGGSVVVDSSPGTGSTFTLTVPVKYSPPAAAPGPTSALMDQIHRKDQILGKDGVPGGAPPEGAAAARRPLAASAFADDREHLVTDKRMILVIEDDVAFAEILCDLSHEMGFQCVAVHAAEDGLIAAARFHPSAILLDVNLPDFSGMRVLDRLKRDSRTRHIPVHVVSVGDYRREALELGAAGYALKPAKREELIEALRRLETKLSQSVRRVLVVEDDPHQRESIRELLGSGDVQITDAETAQQALRELSATTFDCVVLDFHLPDATGYELLEKMAQSDEVSFPPVIVYTGRALSREEEQRLGRYSRSIIIKDARSPERLLDEVTLFLHQVESKLPAPQQQMLKAARNRDSALQGRRILVVEDDVRNIFALTSVFEPNGATVEIARNGREALDALSRSKASPASAIDMVLMDIMMPEMDGLTATREIRKDPDWKKLPIIALTAKAMRDDHEKCLAAGANDYVAKPLDVEKLLSLVRVWMPK